MSYHDYNWQCKDAPIRWRLAELYARFLIGWAWSIALFVLLSYLIGTTSSEWAVVAFVVLMFWGTEMVTPESDSDD